MSSGGVAGARYVDGKDSAMLADTPSAVVNSSAVRARMFIEYPVGGGRDSWIGQPAQVRGLQQHLGRRLEALAILVIEARQIRAVQIQHTQ